MKNRWLIALSAVGIHISIGSVYAWSVLTKPIMRELGASLQEVQWTFSLAILFLGLSAAFLGNFVEKHGPQRAGLFAAAFFCAGLCGTGLAVYLKSLPLLYLFYGVIGGIGLGTGYITPVSTLVKWFPEKRAASRRAWRSWGSGSPA
jgi:OFA family oxalate/formate antiporter-like MFS transporter